MHWKKRGRGVILDLDGTIADFVAPFRHYCETQTGISLGDTTDHLEKVTVKAYGAEKARELRTAFYGTQMHGFSRLPPIYGASEFTWTLRSLGYTIHIVTCRPQWEYPNILPDTLYWLDRNGFQFDTIDLIPDKKTVAACYRRGSLCPLAIDDYPEYVDQLSPSCCKVYVPPGPQNENAVLPHNAERFTTFEDLKLKFIEFAY